MSLAYRSIGKDLEAFWVVSRDLYQESLREISDEKLFTKSSSHCEG